MDTHKHIQRISELETRVPLYVAEIMRLKSELAVQNGITAALSARLKEVEKLYNTNASELAKLQ